MRKAILLTALSLTFLSGCGHLASAERTDARVTGHSTAATVPAPAETTTAPMPEESVTSSDETSAVTESAPVSSTTTAVTAQTAPERVTAPGAVNVTKTVAYPDSVILYWDRVECSGYIVYLLENGKWGELTTIADPGAANCRVMGLAENTGYKFKLRAYNTGADGTVKQGELSDEITVVTPAYVYVNPAVTQAPSCDTPDAPASPADTAPADHTPNKDDPPEAEYSGYVIIGDSRAVEMSQAEAVRNSGRNVHFIAKWGMGYNWFEGDALAALEDHLRQNGGKRYKIVMTMGVNDVVNIDRYIGCYNGLIDRYPEHSFYFVSVNPIIDGRGYSCTNSTIDEFNSRLASAFPDRYVDTASMLKTDGFETQDGLHYSESTYARIFDRIMEEIG